MIATLLLCLLLAGYAGLIAAGVVALTAGWAKLCTMVLNRVHSRPYPEAPLKAGKLLFYAVVLAYPATWLVVLVRLGIGDFIERLVFYSYARAPFAVTGLNWPPLSTPEVPWGTFETVLALVGLIGLLFLIENAIRWRWYRLPRVVRQHDVSEKHYRLHEWADALARRWVFRLFPWNEQLRPRFERAELHLPDWPEAWHGLRVLHLSDLHYHTGLSREYFEQLTRDAQQSQPDLILVTGDLLDDLACLPWLESTLGSLSAPLGRYFLLGNHDWYLDEGRIRQTMIDLGWTPLAGRCEVLWREGHPLELLGDELPWMGTAPGTAGSAAAGTGPSAEGPVPTPARIYAAHTPDRLAAAQQTKSAVMFAGHVHGGQIRPPLLGPIFSPSWYGTRYVSGVFERPPTVLVVTRGVGGRETLRYGCPPEVSTWTLMSSRGESRSK